jgi:hypothetical protein
LAYDGIKWFVDPFKMDCALQVLEKWDQSTRSKIHMLLRYLDLFQHSIKSRRQDNMQIPST